MILSFSNARDSSVRIKLFNDRIEVENPLGSDGRIKIGLGNEETKHIRLSLPPEKISLKASRKDNPEQSRRESHKPPKVLQVRETPLPKDFKNPHGYGI